jgi:acylphosphatase
MRTIRMIVVGKVQGVNYRASAKKTAEQLILTGWIKNLPDRNVEIKVTGSEEFLQKFIDWCRQGPLAAVVKDVIVEDIQEERFTEFRILK